MDYFWVIKDSPYKSKLIEKSEIFGNNIYLLDHLSGREPFLMNGNPKNDLKICSCLLLDSNMMSAIHQFINGNNINGMLDFIEFSVNKKIGFSPYFYYMEAYTKSKRDESTRNYLIKHTESLLKIYLMDEQYFLEMKSYRETKDNSKKNYYLNGKSIKDMATERVDKFIKNYKSFEIQIEIIEILLMKMIFIKFFENEKSPINKKMEIFDVFMQQTFGRVFAREMFLAKKFFNNQTGRIFGIQKNSQKNKVINTIKSTAWDLFLLRIPEYSFINDGSNEFDFGFIVTQEKELYKLGKLFEYDKIYIDIHTPIATFTDSLNINQEKKNIKVTLEEPKYIYDGMMKFLEQCYNER